MAVCLSDKIQFHGGELKVGEWTTLLIFSKRGPGNHEDRRRILEARINQLLGKRNYPGMHLKEIKLELFDDAEGARRVILSLLRTAT